MKPSTNPHASRIELICDMLFKNYDRMESAVLIIMVIVVIGAPIYAVYQLMTLNRPAKPRQHVVAQPTPEPQGIAGVRGTDPTPTPRPRPFVGFLEPTPYGDKYAIHVVTREPDFEVRLYRDSKLIAHALAEENGCVVFDGIAPGNYRIISLAPHSVFSEEIAAQPVVPWHYIGREPAVTPSPTPVQSPAPTMSVTPFSNTDLKGLVFFTDASTKGISDGPDKPDPNYLNLLLPEYRFRAHRLLAVEAKRERQVARERCFIMCSVLASLLFLGWIAITVERDWDVLSCFIGTW